MLEDSPRPAQPQTYTVSLPQLESYRNPSPLAVRLQGSVPARGNDLGDPCSTRRYRNVAVVKAAARPPHSKKGCWRDCCEEVDTARLLVRVLPLEKKLEGSELVEELAAM